MSHSLHLAPALLVALVLAALTACAPEPSQPPAVPAVPEPALSQPPPPCPLTPGEVSRAFDAPFTPAGDLPCSFTTPADRGAVRFSLRLRPAPLTPPPAPPPPQLVVDRLGEGTQVLANPEFHLLVLEAPLRAEILVCSLDAGSAGAPALEARGLEGLVELAALARTRLEHGEEQVLR